MDERELSRQAKRRLAILNNVEEVTGNGVDAFRWDAAGRADEVVRHSEREFRSRVVYAVQSRSGCGSCGGQFHPLRWMGRSQPA